jgi:hypothetical protein
VGASAALLGLLFVTISINLKHILEHPHLPGSADGTLGMLLSALVVSTFGLAPGQSNHVLGVEVPATGAGVSIQAVLVSKGKRGQGEPEPAGVAAHRCVAPARTPAQSVRYRAIILLWLS